MAATAVTAMVAAMRKARSVGCVAEHAAAVGEYQDVDQHDGCDHTL